MKRIILTERDNQIIEFLNQYKCATTSTIANLFFNGSRRPTTRRLKHLREHGFIKSSQEYVSIEQIHYVSKKPSQLRHSCILSNFISKLHENNIEIIKTKVEFKIDNIRSDGLVICKINNDLKIFLIEVCITKKFDLKKYQKLKQNNNWKNIIPIFPTVIVISDKLVDIDKNLNIICMNLKLDNFNL